MKLWIYFQIILIERWEVGTQEWNKTGHELKLGVNSQVMETAKMPHHWQMD
jgi:hypothetical protein